MGQSSEQSKGRKRVGISLDEDVYRESLYRAKEMGLTYSGFISYVLTREREQRIKNQTN